MLIFYHLLKVTSPGLPDFYQGAEFWDLNLVDPDNRRPVDFSKREWLLNEMISREHKDRFALINELLKTREDGRIKMFLTYKALQVRRKKRNVFERGEYVPLAVEGKYKEKVLAFARVYRPDWILTVVPRFLTDVIREDQYPLGRDIWGDTHVVLPKDSPSRWNDQLCGVSLEGSKTLAVGDMLKYFPCSLLLNGRKPSGKSSMPSNEL